MAENKIGSSHSKRTKGCKCNNHIRYDEEDNFAVADNSPSLSNNVTPQSFTGASTPHNSRKRNKRKRKHTTTTTQEREVGDKTFNGLIVAISTLESKHEIYTNDNNVDPYQNHKTLKQALQKLGATISPQVHKRVHYLISTDCAVKNLTQRVRQALKRSVDMVDVAWVKDCKEQKTRVKVDKYLRNELAKCLMMEKTKEKKEKVANERKYHTNKLDEDQRCVSLGEDSAGWSNPVELGCCCVCHENGDDKCPWCTDCVVTRARLALKK